MQLSSRANNRLWDAVLREVLIDNLNCEAEGIEDILKDGENPDHFDRADRMIMKKAKSIGRKDRVIGFVKMTGKVLTLISAALGILFSGLLTQPDVFASVEKVLFSSFQTHDSYEGYEDTDDSDIGGFDKEKRPGYIPDGYELRQIEYGGGMVNQKYESEKGVIILSYSVLSASKISIDNEHHVHESVNENGFEYHYYSAVEADDISTLICFDDYYLYSISGVLSKEELFKMMKSINGK